MAKPIKHKTAFQKRCERLGLDLADVVRLTRAPRATVLGYRTGRPVPRPVMRLLAAWRLLHWGQF